MNEHFKEISLKNLLIETVSIFKRNIYAILYLSAFPFLAFTLLYLYAGNGSMEAILIIPRQIVYIIYTLFLFSFLLIFPIVMVIVHGESKDEAITIWNTFNLIKGRLLKLFFAIILIFVFMMILTTIILLIANLTMNSIFVSSLLAVVFSCISIKLLVDFLFFEQAIVLNNLNPYKALKYSAVLSKKRWWKVFNFYFILNLCIFLCMNVISLLVATLLPVPLLSNIVIAFVQSITVLFTQVFLTVMYLQLEDI